MDAQTNAAFVAHIRKLEAMAIAGDETSVRSLACMALLVEGHRPGPNDGGGCEIITLSQYRLVA